MTAVAPSYRSVPARTPPPDLPPPAETSTLRRAGIWIRNHLHLVGLAVVLWGLDAAASLRTGTLTSGLQHASAAQSISKDLTGNLALVMNHWLAGHHSLAVAAAVYYMVMHIVVTAVVAVVLLRRGNRKRFRFHRDALVATSSIALIVFWFYPVAPPRMLPGYHDVTAASVPLFSSLVKSKAADQFASLPSLHVTWAIWVAVVGWTILRHPLWRALAAGYPLLTTLDVLATGNHYTLDVLAAPAVLALSYGLAVLITRSPRSRRHQLHLRLLASQPAGRSSSASPMGLWPVAQDMEISCHASGIRLEGHEKGHGPSQRCRSHRGAHHGRCGTSSRAGDDAVVRPLRASRSSP